MDEETNKRLLTNEDCRIAARLMAVAIKMDVEQTVGVAIKVFGIPRGGVPVTYLLSAVDFSFRVVDNPAHADVFVDDIVDSGKTKKKWQDAFNKPFFALAQHLEQTWRMSEWLIFPWELEMEGSDTSAVDIVTRLLQYIGEDPKREGLRETPERVLKAWQHWAGGYNQNPAEILKCFKDGAENYGDNMVTVKNIPFYSTCEHHLAPFFGTATISYIPNGKVVGLSKLSRLLSIFAQRLQVQERLTSQVAEALHKHLEPVGCGVLLKARHMCMESRGIQQQGSETITTALRGDFMEDHKVRAEFLSLAQ